MRKHKAQPKAIEMELPPLEPPSWIEPLKRLIPVLVVLWPAIYLIRDLVPVGGTYTFISNDFGGLYYPYKAYLLACLSEGRIPLWSPSEAAGYPFFSNPFAQVFYPLNLLLLLYYKIAGSYTHLDHQYYTVFGLSIFALGLYCWLKQLNSNLRAVVFSTLIMSVSFKMTEMVRFPNAVHTAAWYPWILFAITKLFYARSRKETLLTGLALFFFIVCLCTGGYPYYLYYAVFLIPVYVVFLLTGPLRRRILGDRVFYWKQGLIQCTLFGGLAGVVCLPYLQAIRRLMEQTVDRGGKNFHYSTWHLFNFQDSIGSLIYPPLSQAEGWYYFSITALLLIIVYVLSFPGWRKTGDPIRLPMEPYQRPVGMIFLLLWIAIISYISYGKESALFKLLWNTMPGFSSLRAWGRLNIILVPLLAWLLSLAYSHFESRLLTSGKSASAGRARAFISLLAGYGVILLVQQYYYTTNMTDSYWQFFPYLSGFRGWFLIFGFAGFLIVAALLLLSGVIRKQVWGPVAVPAILVLIAMIEMWPVGANTWVEQHIKSPVRKPLSIHQNNMETFTCPRSARNATISLSSQFGVERLESWHLDNYVKFLMKTQREVDSRNILLGVNEKPKRVFLSQSIQYPAIDPFLIDSRRFQETGKMVSYTGDELVWDVTMPIEGYLSFIDNWDPYWKAYVDGKEIPIELLFGTFKSVRLNPGSHQVIFRYEPTLRAIFLGPDKGP